jgi:hypothetical protein
MNVLSHSELHDVTGGRLIVAIGGAFLAGVLGGYVAEKTEQFLDGLSEPDQEPDETKPEAS